MDLDHIIAAYLSGEDAETIGNYWSREDMAVVLQALEVSAGLYQQQADHLAASQARVARLEEALRRWTTADHGYPLHIGRCESADGGPCTCGLEEAISALAPTEAAPC